MVESFPQSFGAGREPFPVAAVRVESLPEVCGRGRVRELRIHVAGPARPRRVDELD